MHLARALGRALHRPAILPTPALALRAIFGEAAVVLLASQRVAPEVAKRFGFAWEFASLDAALREQESEGSEPPGYSSAWRREGIRESLEDEAWES